MGKHSKQKGATFERLVAKLVVGIFQKYGATAKDCYRTPLSGGHPTAEKGDLVISPWLQQAFAFCVECKHYKTWKPGAMFYPRGQEMKWLEQVVSASLECGAAPLLVMSGNNTGIFVAMLTVQYNAWVPDKRKGATPRLRFLGPEEDRWTMVPWNLFAELAVARAQVYGLLKKRG